MNNYLFTQTRKLHDCSYDVEFKRNYIITAQNSSIAQREMNRQILENFSIFERETDEETNEFLDNTSALIEMKSHTFENDWEIYQEELTSWNLLAEDNGWAEEYSTYESYLKDKPKLILSEGSEKDAAFIVKFYDALDIDEIPFDEDGWLIYGQESDCNLGDLPEPILIDQYFANLLQASEILD